VPLQRERPEEGDAQSTRREGVERSMGRGRGEQEGERSEEASAEQPVARAADERHQRGEGQGMAEAAVAELGRVGHAQPKGDHVRSGSTEAAMPAARSGPETAARPAPRPMASGTAG
jgi:hypothetical protein